MNCQAVVERIIGQSGRQALAPPIEQHLWDCPSCSKIYLEQQALWRQMDAWEAPEISAGFDHRLFARIGRRLAEPWAGLNWLLRPLRFPQPAFSAALACVLLIAALVVERGGDVAPLPDTAVTVQAVDRDDLRQIDTALDDIEMLSEFEILPVGQSEEGRS